MDILQTYLMITLAILTREVVLTKQKMVAPTMSIRGLQIPESSEIVKYAKLSWCLIAKFQSLGTISLKSYLTVI